VDPSRRIPAGDTLDVRPAREFRVGHFESAVSIPLDQLGDSLYLLPPKRAPLWVYGDDNEVRSALELLRARGYEAVEPHPAMAPGAAPSQPVDSKWVGGDARARLWKPTPFLAEVLDEASPREASRALDVACGSGRDAAYLALEGFRVTGVDILADALHQARSLAQSIEVEPDWVQADVERHWPFRPGVFDFVVCVRFLSRPLFPVLADSLSPGGILVYQTFTRDQIRHGKPRSPEHLLAPGELREAFEALGLTVVRYREEDPEGGPALASLWAIRH
jgi:tellurite methyltransferase